jgi:hypothetical protein
MTTNPSTIDTTNAYAGHPYKFENLMVNDVQVGDLVLLDGVYGIERVRGTDIYRVEGQGSTVKRLALERRPIFGEAAPPPQRYAVRFLHEPVIVVHPPAPGETA